MASQQHDILLRLRALLDRREATRQRAATGEDRSGETLGEPLLPTNTVAEAGLPQEGGSLIPTGVSGVDRLFPGGGLRCGTLQEWLFRGRGTGAEEWAVWLTSRALSAREGACVVVDRHKTFSPLGAVGRGIDLERLLLVHPAQRDDLLWTCDQVLRSSAVCVLLCELPEVPERAMRRLQLAAEQGGTLGLFVRPWAIHRTPSWAEVRGLVSPCVSSSVLASSAAQNRPGEIPRGRRLHVEILRARGGLMGQQLDVEWDDETGALRLVTELAHPAAGTGEPHLARRPNRAAS